MRRRTALSWLWAGWAFGHAGQNATAQAWTDHYGDGWPDQLRLTNRRDQENFRGWFVWLADSIAQSDPQFTPREISDCAALLRYCFRESLRPHHSDWANHSGFDRLPPLSDVQRVQYPMPSLGAALFRVRPGPFRPADIANGAFRQFADAEHLMRTNCYPLGRELRMARPADLLFYRQLDSSSPFHSMIFAGDHVVYHTGPIGRQKGEMRAPTLKELAQHPEPRWHPVPGNTNFLGVYRWNILRDSV